MNTRPGIDEYNIDAVSTVARCAGLDLGEVITTLGRRIWQFRVLNRNVPRAMGTKHRRAIETVAKYAGLDARAVVQHLDHGCRRYSVGLGDHGKAA
jgi:hypothetical protein